MESKNKVRMAIIITIAVLVIVFLVQNAALVEVRLYFWPISIPRSLLIITSMGVGALATYIFMMRKKDQRTRPVQEKNLTEDQHPG